MVTDKQVSRASDDAGALIGGRFELLSKLRANRHFPCADVLGCPRRAAGSGKLGKRIDGVVLNP